MDAINEIDKLQKIILKLAEEVQEQIEKDEDEDVDESTTTANFDGYQTPFAFSGNRKKDKKKKDQIIKAGGYKRVNEDISVFDERHFGKKGIIIMIDDNGKKVSAIFKNKKNADKYNRNNQDDVKKLLALAKNTKYPKAIDEAKKMDDDPCWDDYEMVGMKMKNGKEVPNCVPKNESFTIDSSKFPKIKKILDLLGKGEHEKAATHYDKLSNKEKDYFATFHRDELGFMFNEGVINEMGSYADVKKKATELVKQLKAKQAELKKNPKDTKLKAEVADLKKKLVKVAHDVKSKKNESIDEATAQDHIDKFKKGVDKSKMKFNSFLDKVQRDLGLSNMEWNVYKKDYVKNGKLDSSIFDDEGKSNLKKKYKNNYGDFLSENSLGKTSISKLAKKSKIFNKFKKHVEDDLEGYIDDVISGQGKDVVVYYTDNSGNGPTKRGLTKRLTLENYVPYQTEEPKRTNRRIELRKGEGSANQKIGVGIREVRKQLSEIEKFLRWYKEIKTESDMGSDQYWKRTQNHLMKIKERVVNIAKSIKELDN